VIEGAIMCCLADVYYHELRGNVRSIYEIDEYGIPTQLVNTLRRFEPRNIEQQIARAVDDLGGLVPFRCRCGAQLPSWDAVMDHCELYPCRTCQRATPKWDGWDCRCPACDMTVNPSYHERNPGYYGR